MNNPCLHIELAPLRGITLRTFRNAFHRHFKGIDSAITPFIPTVNCERIKTSLLKDIDLNIEQSIPIIPQIIGNRPDDIINMCRKLHDMGHEEINWNLGCPHKPVTRKKRGSGLLPHREMIEPVLDRIFSDGSFSFSIKARLGMNNPDELHGLVEVFNGYPLKKIIIHPRTASQMFSGNVDLNRFEQCCKVLKCPVVYNGDIRSKADFLALQKRLPDIRDWMIGRGLITNPFLAENIHETTFNGENRKNRIIAFMDDLFSGYSGELSGPAHILGRMKEIWAYLSLSFSNGHSLLRKIQRSSSIEEYRNIVEVVLNSDQITTRW